MVKLLTKESPILNKLQGQQRDLAYFIETEKGSQGTHNEQEHKYRSEVEKAHNAQQILKRSTRG